MPTIGRTLHATGAELQLVVAGYTVSYAMALITGARMGDLYGRRRMFLIGVLVFTVASLACGIAPGIEILIAARFVQGAGAAAMIPQIMSVIQVRFSGAARARALPVPDAGLGPGAGGVRACAGGDVRLAGGGDGARGGRGDPAGPHGSSGPRPGGLKQFAHASQLAQASSNWAARRDGNHDNATSRRS
jgi:MFS family permease